MAQITYQFACLVKQLCWEWSGTYTRTVSLHDTIDFANLVGTNTQTGTGSCTNSIAGGDKGIRAKVNVEHSALGSLAKNTLACSQHFVDLVL